MDETSKLGRPKTGVTKLRAFRMDDELYDKAGALALRRDETVTALVIRAVEREVRRLERNPLVDLDASPRYRRRRAAGEGTTG